MRGSGGAPRWRQISSQSIGIGDFLVRLGLDFEECSLGDFWPPNGPVWDGLAVTDGGRAILVEAKANIPELDSDPTSARPPSVSQEDQGVNAQGQGVPEGEVGGGLDTMLLPVRQQAGASLFAQGTERGRRTPRLSIFHERHNEPRRGSRLA